MGNILGLSGYVQNHVDKSVVGEACGPASQMTRMKNWLTNTGSKVRERNGFNMMQCKLEIYITCYNIEI